MVLQTQCTRPVTLFGISHLPGIDASDLYFAGKAHGNGKMAFVTAASRRVHEGREYYCVSGIGRKCPTSLHLVIEGILTAVPASELDGLNALVIRGYNVAQCKEIDGFGVVNVGMSCEGNLSLTSKVRHVSKKKEPTPKLPFGLEKAVGVKTSLKRSSDGKKKGKGDGYSDSDSSSVERDPGIMDKGVAFDEDKGYTDDSRESGDESSSTDSSKESEEPPPVIPDDKPAHPSSSRHRSKSWRKA